MRLRSLAIVAAALLTGAPAFGQAQYPVSQPGGASVNAQGVVVLCPTANNLYVPCGTAGALPLNAPVQAPAAPVPIGGNSTGSTGAVVGTLAAAPGKYTYICGFNVSGIGGTAALGPITVAGLAGGSQIYQLSATASGITLQQNFTPCLPSSAPNTGITVTTTADGTATAVDVNSWGYQQ